jgi:hypothetical protein
MIVELGENMGSSGCNWDLWNVEKSCVSSLYMFLVG